ncbi:Hypothetical predicted protein [Mytilus galloprovincialis]|uniref:Uncharacterized protein n=1 Tax=Mytilus galloprovincialis TaxID=29158 RepID=A0A8B6GRP4_MYTGA|nr:Hypothetical predicted protein [Mytilus galloprovincialis]
MDTAMQVKATSTTTLSQENVDHCITKAVAEMQTNFTAKRPVCKPAEKNVLRERGKDKDKDKEKKKEMGKGKGKGNMEMATKVTAMASKVTDTENRATAKPVKNIATMKNVDK